MARQATAYGEPALAARRRWKRWTRRVRVRVVRWPIGLAPKPPVRA